MVSRLAECVAPTGCLTGGGPLWSASEGCLWWTDAARAKLHRYNPATGNARRWDLPLHASGLAVWRGRLLMAGDREVGVYDPATEEYDKLHDIPGAEEGDRASDSGVAPDGAFWFGLRDEAGRQPRGNYYRLSPKGALERLRFDPVVTANTLAWSPDGRVFYTADSAEQEILAFDHDPDTGVLTDRRVFAATDETGGYPFGSAMDAAGCLWNAQWDAGCVVRYAPDGAIDRIVELPVSRPTGCAFGGPDLATLFITTARAGLAQSELFDRQPLAGGLFALQVSTPGLETPDYAGAG
ncbi:MAG: SMP-30/gluconolactonase/LRE family protein [Pseudomonadota bacterium]